MSCTLTGVHLLDPFGYVNVYLHARRLTTPARRPGVSSLASFMTIGYVLNALNPHIATATTRWLF